MKVNGQDHRTLWAQPDEGLVCIIDQTLLPHRFEIIRLRAVEEVVRAIAEMRVRGAPLIGVAACFGVWLAMRDNATDASLEQVCDALSAARPTAINLAARIREARATLRPLAADGRATAALRLAQAIAEEEVAISRSIGEHGHALIRRLWEKKGRAGPVNVLTHCNAGWLATVDWGTALAPVYLSHRSGIPVHVWVDETRPRNQGHLTAWELTQEGVPNEVIVDNAGGHLLQRGEVDLCIVGTDRTTANGDVCNKVGTYLKALAAKDNNVPFYVALPSSSIDWAIRDGAEQIPIEHRSPKEVEEVIGVAPDGSVIAVRVIPLGSKARNPGFDVTPARLVTALITERGVCDASNAGLVGLFGERR